MSLTGSSAIGRSAALRQRTRGLQVITSADDNTIKLKRKDRQFDDPCSEPAPEDLAEEEAKIAASKHDQKRRADLDKIGGTRAQMRAEVVSKFNNVLNRIAKELNTNFCQPGGSLYLALFLSIALSLFFSLSLSLSFSRSLSLALDLSLCSSLSLIHIHIQQT